MSFHPIQTKASLSSKKDSESEFSVTVFESKKSNTRRHKIPEFQPADRLSEDENGVDQDDIDDIFSDARKRKRKVKEDPRKFDISTARKEIINFGISGFDKETKHQAKIALAIKLGAKPPKKGYRNYKEILEERKREKEECDRSNRRKLGQSFGAAKSFQQQKQRLRQRASNPNSVTKHYGVVNPKIDDKKKKKK
ncbi:uncharacterized protein C1orf131 homolog [Toxorhynchites rutilus septentrionalis]|uniref:uncharacterized protein C1orf131 homolog n=1 Tax=Toxorhynchites rutilus septentrionalis TaxID=329112 RepID=UPI00247A09C2|nr:uncharacterized protein C1orf131 homolog [Toxorhynchites rutilus septentrionalis]